MSVALMGNLDGTLVGKAGSAIARVGFLVGIGRVRVCGVVWGYPFQGWLEGNSHGI